MGPGGLGHVGQDQGGEKDPFRSFFGPFYPRGPEFRLPPVPAGARNELFQNQPGISTGGLGKRFVHQLQGDDEFALNSDSSIVCR